jgi:hypothetical protein
MPEITPAGTWPESRAPEPKLVTRGNVNVT